MINAAEKFVIGFAAPARGAFLLMERKRIRHLSIIPLLLTILIFSVGGFFGILAIYQEYAPKLTRTMLGYFNQAFGQEPGVIYWLTLIFFVWPVLMFTLLYALFIVSRLCAAPFFSMLAERTLIEEGVLPDAPFRLGPWLRVAIRMFGASIAKSVLFILIGTVFFVISFIPVLNILSSAGLLLIVAFDMMDYAFEALQMKLGSRIKFFRSHLPVFLGLAMSMGLVFLIPGLSFLLFPATVVGGSDVVRRLHAHSPLARPHE